MNADKIKDMRDVARSLVGPQKSSPNLPVIAIMLNVAASELERLGKIEAAAKEVFRQYVNQSQDGIQDSVSDLAITVELNPCPTT